MLLIKELKKENISHKINNRLSEKCLVSNLSASVVTGSIFLVAIKIPDAKAIKPSNENITASLNEFVSTNSETGRNNKSAYIILIVT
jgi:hypothetical protein